MGNCSAILQDAIALEPEKFSSVDEEAICDTYEYYNDMIYNNTYDYYNTLASGDALDFGFKEFMHKFNLVFIPILVIVGITTNVLRRPEKQTHRVLDVKFEIVKMPIICALFNNISKPDEDKETLHKTWAYIIWFTNLSPRVPSILNILVFTTTHLRMQLSSLYLVSLATADCIYLLALFIGWFGWIDIHLFHRPFWCQTVVYVTYVCGFISVWNVASFTIERYIVVCHPFMAKFPLANSSRRWTITLLLGEAFLALVLYSFSLFTSGVVEMEGIGDMCSTKPDYVELLRYATQADTLLTLVVPMLIIVLLNIKLYATAYITVRRNYPSVENTYSSGSRGTRDLRDTNVFPPPGTQMDRTAQRHQMKTTRMLIIVSTVFVCLHLPSHAFKIYTVWYEYNLDDLGTSTGSVNDDTHSALFFRCQEILSSVYYTNFAINFFLYSASRKAFRVALIRMLCRYRYNIRCISYRLREWASECTDGAVQEHNAVVLAERGGYVIVRNRLKITNV